MAKTLKEQLGIDEIRPGEFVSQSTPGRMGNSLPIAYGGVNDRRCCGGGVRDERPSLRQLA